MTEPRDGSVSQGTCAKPDDLSLILKTHGGRTELTLESKYQKIQIN